LWKILLQQQQQQQQNFDPSNPNKNVINIISINICGKNEQQQQTQQLPLFINNLGNSNQNFKSTSVNVNNLKNITVPSQATTSSSNNNTSSCDTYVNKEESTDSFNKINSLINASTLDSPNHERVSFFDQDFYEGDSSDSFGFNPKNEMDEVDKFFNW